MDDLDFYTNKGEMIDHTLFAKVRILAAISGSWKCFVSSNVRDHV